jgi:NADPH:quinone reductase
MRATPAVRSHLPVARNISVYFMVLPTSALEARRLAQEDIARWTGSGPRMLTVAGTFPLYETTAAHKAVGAGGKIGTMVVEPQR